MWTKHSCGRWIYNLTFNNRHLILNLFYGTDTFEILGVAIALESTEVSSIVTIFYWRSKFKNSNNKDIYLKVRELLDLKMNKFKKLFHKSLHFNQLISWLSFYAEHLDYLRRKYPKRLSVVDLKNLKSSDTLYILGCGASIRNLTHSDWESINRNDSLALNLWYKSSFVPNFWMWEPPRDKKIRDNEFSGMQKLLNDKSCFAILKNWQNLYSYYAPQEARELARKFNSAVMMRRTHIYSPKQMDHLRTYIKSSYFHFYRGSLFLAIIIARLMGYKNIILCGVDLSGGYFYDSGSPSGNKIHNTAIEKNGISMKDALFRLKSILLEEGIILDTHETCKFKLS